MSMEEKMNCANKYCDSYSPESTALCRICKDIAELEREVPLYDRYTRETVRERNYDPDNGHSWSGRRWDE